MTLVLEKRLKEVFTEKQAMVLANVIASSYDDLIKAKDFNELKDIVRDIAREQRGLVEAQKESQKEIGRLDRSMQELAEAQKRTEIKVKELAEAQKESQKEIGRLDRSMQELAEAQKESQKEIGRLDRSMQELAEAQKESQKEIGRLDRSMQELAEAQKRTEIKVKELAEAQKESQKEIGRLDRSMQELAEAQKQTEVEIQKLTKGLTLTRQDLGGLSRSMGYGFENEAYRMLPNILLEKYKIKIEEKIIREEIGGKEINLFGKGTYEGKEVLVVGESKLRLDEKRTEEKDVFEELEEKIKAVRIEYKDREIIKVLITHYATKEFIKKAKEKGIIIVQSFEW